MLKCDPQGRPMFGPQEHNFNKLGSGLLDDATYWISRLYALWFQTRSFLKFSSQESIFNLCDLDMQQLLKRAIRGSFLLSRALYAICEGPRHTLTITETWRKRRSFIPSFCFAMHYFVSILVLQSSWRGRESWLLCYYCLTDVLLLWMFCGSPSRWRGLVCTVCDCGISWSYLLFRQNPGSS